MFDYDRDKSNNQSLDRDKEELLLNIMNIFK